MGTLDAQLEARLDKYREALERGNAGNPGAQQIDIYIRYTGDAQPIIDAGVKRASIYSSGIYGRVRLADVEKIAALPGTELMGMQATYSPTLNESVPDANVPPIRDSPPNLTGADVVVGVIDTGIDIFHQAFRTSDGSTRITALWDQTIETTDAADHPPGMAYGKLFDQDAIDDALDAGEFESLDADGHGTHVAGIAAGDGSQSGNCSGSGTYVGVAPEADLVIVKYNFTDQGYLDATRFIFSTAGTASAVINMSFGRDNTGHDGQAQAEVDLDLELTNAPTGHAVVVAMGNSANDGLHAFRNIAASGTEGFEFEVHPDDRFYASADIWYGTATPVGDPVDAAAAARIRATLHAPDGTTTQVMNIGSTANNQSFAGGKLDFLSFIDPLRVGRHLIRFTLMPAINGVLAAGTWRIEFEETAGAATDLDMWMDHPKDWRQEDNIAANASRDLAVKINRALKATDKATITYTGTARLSVTVTAPDGSATPAVAHDAGAVDHDAGAAHTVKFNNSVDATNTDPHTIQFSIHAKDAGTRIAKGDWTITLEETAGNPTDYDARFPEKRPAIEIMAPDGSKTVETNMPRFVDADRDPGRTVGAPASANNVVAIGAYRPGSDDLADFSSRGPTVDGRQKPDLAAPGVGITAAKTQVQDDCCVSDCCEDFYTDKDGTSMAAPHAAGVVALMFERNGALTFAEVRTALTNSATPVAGGGANEWGAGKLNAQGAVSDPLVTGGGGGGGGGGGSIKVSDETDPVFLPPRATWPLQLPTPERMAELQAMLGGSQIGNIAAALISTHFDEIRAIVNNSRRAAVVWHRMKGPELMKIAMAWPGEPRPFLPEVHAGIHVGAGVRRLLDAVRPSATPSLAADIDRYARFASELPGKRLRDLGMPPEARHG